MQQRPLGKSGLNVSVIALGSAAMGESFGGAPPDDREAIAAIHQAIDAGSNLIDTAPSYGWGHAEELIAKAVVGRRRDVLLATKCGLVRRSNGEGPPLRSLTKSTIHQECERSLRRLHTDTIDLYQCHWPDSLTPIRETIETLQELRRQGKIRAVGLCNFGCDGIVAAREYGEIDAVQISFSLLHRHAEDDLLPFCREHGIAVLAHSPLARGLLTGTLGPESRFSGPRARDPDFVGERFKRNLRAVDRLKEVALGLNKTLPQLAINWVLHQPGVTVPIVGMQRPTHVLDILGSIDWELADRELAVIESILRGDKLEP